MKSLQDKLNEFTDREKEEIFARAETIRKEVLLLKAVREAAGISQEELADKLDRSQSYISRLERRGNITINTIISIVEALGGSLDLTIKLPEIEPMKFSQIEKGLQVMASERNVNDEKKNTNL